MVKFGTVIIIAIAVLLIYLYVDGNETVVNTAQSLYGTVSDLVSPGEEEIQWDFMLDIQGFPLTCSNNDQCAEYYQYFSGVTESVAQANTRCYKLRCEYAEGTTNG